MNKSAERVAIAIITLMGTAVRATTLNQPMRYDEGVSWAYYVGRSWMTIISSYRQPNNHVFYSLLAKFAASPFNYSPWALRLPAFIAGVAIIPLTWLVARKLVPAHVALLAAALCVGSTSLSLFSTNARGYTLVAALFLLLLLLAREMVAKGNAKSAVAMALLGGVGLYTIPVMLYPIAVVSVWCAAHAYQAPPVERKRITVTLTSAVLGMFLLAGILYSPIIAHDGLAAVTGNKFVTPSSWQQFQLDMPENITSTLASWVQPFSALAVPVALVLAIAGAVASWRQKRQTMLVACMVGCGAVLVATHRAPFVRVWLFLIPLFCLAIARSVMWVRAKWIEDAWPSVAVSVAMLVVAMKTQAVAVAPETGLFRPASDVTDVLRRIVRPTDRVLAPPPAIGPLLYYFPMAGLDSTLLTKPLTMANRAFLVLSFRDGQTLDWAVERGIIDRAHFTTPALVAQFAEGAVYVTGPR